MMILDTHAHYDDAAFDEDREAVIASLPSAGVRAVVNMGASLRGAARSLELAQRYGSGSNVQNIGEKCAGADTLRETRGQECSRNSRSLSFPDFYAGCGIQQQELDSECLSFPHFYAGCGIHPDHVGILEEGTDHGHEEADGSNAMLQDGSLRVMPDSDKNSADSQPEQGDRKTSAGLWPDKGDRKTGAGLQPEQGDREETAFSRISRERAQKAWDILRTLASSKECVAVGEIGLDYHWMVEPKEIQQKWFIRQLELAKELDKPINVHSRNAAQDTFDIIMKYHAGTTGGIIHCYSGSVEMAKLYTARGYCLGIGGAVTYPHSKTLKKVVAAIPIEYLVTETDSPYMTPEPVRGTRNNSANIVYVIRAIAQIKGIEEEQAARILYENGRRVYRL